MRFRRDVCGSVRRPPNATAACNANAGLPLGVTVKQLAMNGPVLQERLLSDVWQRHLIAPQTVNNPTDVLLVDAALCTQAGHPLMIYDDFRGLVGWMCGIQHGTWRFGRWRTRLTTSSDVLTSMSARISTNSSSTALSRSGNWRCGSPITTAASRFSGEDRIRTCGPVTRSPI